MSLTRSLRPLVNSKVHLAPARLSASLIASRQLATDTANTSADGASEKTKKDAEPKILNRSPPKEEKAPEEVQEHNQNLENRAERPNEKSKSEQEKDKVGKGFWSGQGAQGM